ncbi:PfkB family carbohydrate kinase [Mycoplasmopsis bovis]|uniref:PfkB family carbohydrate kinase n=1 Tax=Mycoplasmopsis bovis TaxID=28903 RepID=UPI002926BA4A|nr:PfkB family carbohydrate kinase [Mycoplasmopsis bovis]WMX52578.1 PfkB family carbohydrate kinase [Mycoplasmopsis bovis]
MSVVVVGSINYDLYARVNNKISLRDSNPANIYSSLGGVAYNIAKNLALSGIDTTLISAVGNDLEANWIKKQLENDSLNSILIAKNDYKTAKYVALIDNNSDMNVAASDTKITESIDYNDLFAYKKLLDKSTYLCLDANLSSYLIVKLCKNFSDKFIVAEAVSSQKILKFKPVLKHISLLKGNKLEFQALLNTSETDLFILASKVLELGIKSVVITDGENGCIYANNEGVVEFYRPTIVKALSTSGAGDAFCAGLIYGLINKMQILKVGASFAKFSLLSLMTINDKLNKSSLSKELMEVN